MRAFILLILQISVLAFSSGAAQIKSVEISGTKLYYHYLPTDGTKKGLIIFLHGSVAAFKGKTISEATETATLLEGNRDFIPVFNDHGYDIIMPVAFNEFNWLEKNGMVFIDSILKVYAGQYASVFISGFSDGGTGSYRAFYGSNNKRYKGAVIFNGYPQLSNFHKTVKYEQHMGKKVIFCSQESDKVVPFEFLLTEYRRQKITNAETYFFLTEGRHEFVRYSRQDFENLIAVLEQRPEDYSRQNDSMWVYPPVDGLLMDNNVKQLYHFRSKVCKGYGMKPEEYKASTDPELTANNEKVFPLQISKNDLHADYFYFPADLNGRRLTIKIKNYLTLQAW